MHAPVVDYVRYRLSFDQETNLQEKRELIECVTIFCDTYNIPGKPYAENKYWDKATQQHMYYFDCWGRAAQLLYNFLPSSWLTRLMRLDVRIGLDADNLNFKQLYDDAEDRAGERYTVHRFKSPNRAKRAGRDAGGQGIAIGGQGAERRLSVYKRSEHGPAWEYQFLGKALYKMVGDLMTAGVPDGVTFAGELARRVQEDGERWSHARLGCTIEELEQGYTVDTLPIDYTDPEAVLAKMEALYFSLPDEAQEAFTESVCRITEEDAARLAEFHTLTRPEDWEEFPEAPTVVSPRPDAVMRMIEQMTPQDRLEVYRLLSRSFDEPFDDTEEIPF